MKGLFNRIPSGSRVVKRKGRRRGHSLNSMETVPEVVPKSNLELLAEVMSMQESLKDQVELKESLQTRYDSLVDSVSDLQRAKDSLNDELLSLRSSYDEQILSYKRRISELELAAVSSRASSLLHDSSPAHKRIRNESLAIEMEVVRLRELNEALTLELRSDCASRQESERLAQSYTDQKEELSRLNAKLDAYELLKADYSRVLEENERLRRLGDSLSNKIAQMEDRKAAPAAPGSPSALNDLWTYKRETSKKIDDLFSVVRDIFGWKINVDDKQITLARDESFVVIKHGVIVQSKLPPDFPKLTGIEIPHMLALIVLSDSQY